MGRRVLEHKELPFTGSFNPACFPGLDDLFGEGYFDEYKLNTDPSTMIHPLTKEKNKKKATKQKALHKELEQLKTNLTDKLTQSDNEKLTDLSQEVNRIITPFLKKLESAGATMHDINAFKFEFKKVMEKDDYQEVMKTHRGQFIWSGIMDVPLSIETWIRQLPNLFSQPTFSLASKDMFFSTQTSKIADDVCEKVAKLSL